MWPRPDRLHRIHRLVRLPGVLVFVDDRIGDEIGIPLDDTGDHPFVREVLYPGVFFELLQMQGDRCATIEFAGGVDRERAVASGFPLGRFALACAASDQGHPVRNHKGGIESNAKLPNECGERAGGLLLPEALEQLACAGLRDCPDVRDHFIAAHTDSIVVNRESARFRVAVDPDLELVIRTDELGTAERFETQPVQRVRRVGNQFPEKNFFIRVERMNHQVQDLAGLGLKLEGSGIGSHEKECSETGAGGSSWAATALRPPRIRGCINKVDRMISRRSGFLRSLPALEIRAEYEKFPSDLNDPDALILNDSAEMTHRKPSEPGSIWNIQKRPCRCTSNGRLHV